MALRTETRLLIRLALRNLWAHRVKSVIVGSIVLFGTFLVIAGTALVDSVESAMSRSIVNSLAGHLHLYSKDARDQFSIFGGTFMGQDDIGMIPDFAALRDAATEVDNVATVVPLGTSYAMVTPPNELDTAIEALRRAHERGDGAAVADARAKVQALTTMLVTEKEKTVSFSRDKDKRIIELATLRSALGAAFWDGFSDDAEQKLMFLDTTVAPAQESYEMVFLYYLGTDLGLFARTFDRFEVVEGTAVPEGGRGILLNHRFYERALKHQVVRTLDEVHRQVTERGASIAGDPKLAASVTQNARRHRLITFQLTPAERTELTAELRSYLAAETDDLPELLRRVLTVTDANVAERYRWFYEHVAPRIDLYPFKVGDSITVQSYTRTGYPRAATLKIWGTFRFKGMDGSDLTGTYNMVDMASFRNLFGLMTAEARAELADLREAAAVSPIARDEAEAALFGAPPADNAASAPAAPPPTALTPTRAPPTPAPAAPAGAAAAAAVAAARASPVARAPADTALPPVTQSVIDQGIALSAAVMLRDPTRLRETQAALQAALDERGLNVHVIDWQQAAGMLGQFVLVVRLVLAISILVIFIVALVIINNSMIMATMERVSEIGTMRAIGAGRSFVLGMFVVETTVLGAIAGLVGAALAAALILSLGAVGIPAASDELQIFFAGSHLYPSLTVGNVVTGLVVVVLVSIAATIYPAFIATRVAPAVAMHPTE